MTTTYSRKSRRLGDVKLSSTKGGGTNDIPVYLAERCKKLYNSVVDQSNKAKLESKLEDMIDDVIAQFKQLNTPDRVKQQLTNSSKAKLIQL